MEKSMSNKENNQSNNIEPEANFMLDCRSRQECEEYCRNNPEICKRFCEENPEHGLCRMNEAINERNIELEKFCHTKEECDKFCAEHPEEEACKMLGEGELETPEISMPFDYNSISYEDWIIWPFCVHGGDHPEGHGGIDFELKPDSKIYASCDGIVRRIEPSHHGNAVMIECGRIVVGYNGIINLKVKEGDVVKRGDIIGNPVLMGEDSYIHFEINDYIEQKLKCPLPYLTPEFRAKLEEIFSKANYPEKAQEPNLCNCEELPYKDTMDSRR